MHLILFIIWQHKISLAVRRYEHVVGKKRKILPAAKAKWNNIKWKIYKREDRIAVSNSGIWYLMSKKNWFIRIYIREHISRQHTLRIISLYCFFSILWFQDLGFFIWWSEIKKFPSVGIKHKYMGISVHLKWWGILQIPSENTLCKRWGEEKTHSYI